METQRFIVYFKENVAIFSFKTKPLRFHTNL